MRKFVMLIITLLAVWLASGLPPAVAADYACAPTAPDSLGPFYKPDAPVRSSVGDGYVLTGTVKSAADCSPIPGAALEFWLGNPRGNYVDQHRATVMADGSGAYRCESNRPPGYGYRPPHIHVRVTAVG